MKKRITHLNSEEFRHTRDQILTILYALRHNVQRILNELQCLNKDCDHWLELDWKIFVDSFHSGLYEAPNSFHYFIEKHRQLIQTKKMALLSLSCISRLLKSYEIFEERFVDRLSLRILKRWIKHIQKIPCSSTTQVERMRLHMIESFNHMSGYVSSAKKDINSHVL